MRMGSPARMFARFAIVASMICLGATTSHAQWQASQRSTATAECLPACERTAPESARHLCQPYCQCSVAETERRYPDYPAIEQATRVRDPALMAALQDVAQSCARQVTGR